MATNKNQILPGKKDSKTAVVDANEVIQISSSQRAEVDQSSSELMKDTGMPLSNVIQPQPIMRNAFSSQIGQSSNFKSISVEEMKEIHKTNKLESQQAKSAKEFMNKVMYSVPLNKLYQVKACCQYNENANFCPVIIEIIDQKILELNNLKKYIIQVWSNRGEMIFEKPMHRPCCNFNINEDVFVFQEETNSPEVYVVKLHLEQKPIVYKFTLPMSLTSYSHVNPYFDEKLNNFVIPKERELLIAREEASNPNELIDLSVNEGFEEQAKPGKHNLDDIFEMHALGEYESQSISKTIKDGQWDKLNKFQDFPNVSTLFSEKIVSHAPAMMIDFLQGNILLAYRNLIISADVAEYVKDQPSKSRDGNVVHIPLTQDKVQSFDVHQNYKIVAIQNIGHDMSAIVLEDLSTRQIRFLQTELADKAVGAKRLKLIQLGLMVNQTKMTQSKLVKFRSVAKVDPKTQRNYQISLALRENGRVEVYSDFILVNEYMNPTLQCVDIETDFHMFYLKFVKDSDKVTSETKFEQLQYEIRQVRHSWRNRISFNTMKLCKEIDKWNIILHRRIAKYFRLYTQVLNFSTFMLVSHRDMISIFAMGQTDERDVTETWIDSIKFDQGNIRRMFIKKRPKEERQKMIQAKIDAGSISVGNLKSLLSVYKQFGILAMIGTHTVVTCGLSSKGKLTKTREIQAPGRIIRFRDDTKYNQGMLVLTDDSPKATEYTQSEGCYSFNFPYSTLEKSSAVRLYSLKMEKFYELTNSGENESLDADSYLDILRANKHAFDSTVNQIGAGENEVNKYFKESHINVILISSLSKNSQTIVPIVKEKNKEKYIENIRLIKKEAHQKKFNFEDDLDFESHIHSFFATSKDFDKNVDSYCKVGHKALKIYDEDMKLRFTVTGLQIRKCTDVQQGYLYSINDNTTVPYTVKDADDCIVPQPDWKSSPSGLYVMDLQRLFEGKVERYKLATTIGGYANALDDSKFSDRFSFISSFDSISVIPFPHMNVLNCVGMGLKHEYLIWRQNDGFFTALDGKSNLHTWSTISGKMLYSEKQLGSASHDMVDNYEVYRSDIYDTTYTQDFYNLKDYSISLIKSKKQVNATMTFLNKALLLRKLSKRDQNKGRLTINVEKGVRQLESNLLKVREGDQALALKVLNSQQKSNLYHFKVMQLKTHEDTKGASECQVRFHFMFELIEKKQSNLANYDWSVTSNPVQRLYLSRDTRQMMEVINNLVANVYVRDDIDDLGKAIKPEDQDDMGHCQDDYGQQVKWKVAYRIKRFPLMLQGKISQPYLFSPNFTYQLDFNHHTEQFVIKYTRTQHIYMNIPNDLLSLEWSSLKGENALKMILSRFKWEEEDVIRILNRANLDCLFQLSTTDPTDQNMDSRYLKLISCVKVDNLFINMTNRDEAHVFLQKKVLSASEVLARLIQLNQNFKVNTQHAVNTGKKDYNLLREINSIDFKQKWGDHSASFDIQMSFTWLDWYIADKLLKDDTFNLDNMDIEQKIHLVFNIFPKGNGILHLLSLGKSSDQNDDRQTTDQLEACSFAKELFKLCSETHRMNLLGTEDAGSSFEVPILPNMFGQTPLDICMSVNSLSGLEDDVYFKSEDAAKQIEGSENIAMANEIFKNLTNYSFMHSSYQITDSLLQAIRLALPSIGGYLESRLYWIEHSFSTNTQNAIKGKHLRECPASGEYGAMCTSIWAPEQKISKEIFEDSGPLLPMRIVQLDVPHLHSHNPLGFEFIEALDDCENVDIFKLESVQILVDNQYDYWKKINYVAIGFPTVLQVLVFWYWSNVVILAVPLDPDTYQVQETICRIVLITTCVYLLLIESSAMIVRKFYYLTSLEKITNLVNLILIMINVIRSNTTETIFMEIQTWSALIIWFRFLLFLKSLPTFAWLIRMLLACIYDMLTFLAVLFIGVIAFADAFKSIDEILVNEGIVEATEIPEDASGYERFFQNYILSWQKAWRVALGDFAIDLDNYREQDYFVFFICCIFNIILLFNLLIAIISKTFEDVSEAQIQMGYKEKVKQIKSLQDSLYGFKKAIYNPMELLFVVSVISGDEEKELDVPTQLGELSKKIDTMKDELKNFTEEQFDRFAETIAERFGSGLGLQKKGKKNFIRQATSHEEPEDARVAKVQAGSKGQKAAKK